MSDQPSLRCVNCGSSLGVPPAGATVIRCPVCQLDNPLFVAPASSPLTAELFARGLEALVSRARSSGVSGATIVSVLRDELEFAAELATVGRQLHVQILDLGPAEGQPTAAPVRDRTTVLRGRAMGE
jgi:hypothetical protein